jgi:hemoglobin
LASADDRALGVDRDSTGAPDLDSRTEIYGLVVHFYREIVFDPILAPVFEDVAETDWAVHIPRLTSYWCRVLLGEPGYDGALLAAHDHVHRLQAFEPVHFDRWYELWVTSIDERWVGPNAERAKRHAAKIMAVLARRLSPSPGEPELFERDR